MQVFESDECGFCFSLHELHVFFIRLENGFVTISVPKFFGGSGGSFKKLAVATNFFRGIRYVEENQLCIFRPDRSSANKGL